MKGRKVIFDADAAALGYWVANGDISPERAAEIVRELATA